MARRLTATQQKFLSAQTAIEIPAAMIEEKLHRLKTWHENALMTGDEYLPKRQELLKRF